MRWILCCLLSVCLFGPLVADDGMPPAKNKDKKDDKPSELITKKTGRPGELTPAEEDKVDGIVENFIRYDTGVQRNEKHNADFEDLGVEGIPGLVRGFNKSARLSYSCPASKIAKKLKRLMRDTDDPRTLDFIRENVGIGLDRRNPYSGLASDLKVACMLRKADIDRERQLDALKQHRGSSPGERGPREGK